MRESRRRGGQMAVQKTEGLEAWSGRSKAVPGYCSFQRRYGVPRPKEKFLSREYPVVEF